MKKEIKGGLDPILFAERVREARGDLSQADFAEMCGCTAQTISTYENAGKEGGRVPSLDVAVAIAKTAGVSLNWLAGMSRIKELWTEDDSNLKLDTYWDLYSVYSAFRKHFPNASLVVEHKHTEPDGSDMETEVVLRVEDERLADFRDKETTIEALLGMNLGNSAWELAMEGLQGQMRKEPLPGVRKMPYMR